MPMIRILDFLRLFGRKLYLLKPVKLLRNKNTVIFPLEIKYSKISSLQEIASDMIDV